MAFITKELAHKIAAKLKAQIDDRPGRPHDIASVYHNGKLVATFGIRRGSSKELGHDHIPRDLQIRPREARLLGQCPWSREDWIAVLSARGVI